MNDIPCDFAISSQSIANTDFVRIEARDHLKSLVQIDISQADFTAALLGRQVMAALTLGRKDP